MAGKLTARSHTLEKLSLGILAVKTLHEISVSEKSNENNIIQKKIYDKKLRGENNYTRNFHF